MTRLERIIFWMTVLIVCLLVFQVNYLNRQLVIAKDNQDKILEILIQRQIIDGINIEMQ